MPSRAKSFANGAAVARTDIVSLAGMSFPDRVSSACREGGRLGALVPVPCPGGHDLVAVVLHDGEARLSLIGTRVATGRSFRSLTPGVPAAQAHERAVLEDLGLRPEGHPWPKPLRRHRELEPEGPDRAPPHPFFRVDGPGLHEVAVGPVHAGVIEPGHFRFQCSGETVHHLEIHLGYQHRGVERLMLAAPPGRRLVLAESIAGDTAVGHALAHCTAVEGLAGAEVPAAARWVRAAALELERLANHVGDLGALCNDVGYLPGASWFGRLRAEFLNALGALSGNRFGRGLLVPGGVRRVPAPEVRRALLERLGTAATDLEDVAGLAFESASVLSRFERTGVVDRGTADALGLTGPCARASGCDRDVRRDHPAGLYRDLRWPVATAAGGDVLGRATVRWHECRASLELVRLQLECGADGPASAGVGPAAPGAFAVALVEGWRGEILHALATGDDGRLAACHVVDPSLRNWFGLAMALRGNAISDFPLCNKSFNLSYAGHDL